MLGPCWIRSKEPWWLALLINLDTKPDKHGQIWLELIWLILREHFHSYAITACISGSKLALKDWCDESLTYQIPILQTWCMWVVDRPVKNVSSWKARRHEHLPFHSSKWHLLKSLSYMCVNSSKRKVQRNHPLQKLYLKTISKRNLKSEST